MTHLPVGQLIEAAQDTPTQPFSDPPASLADLQVRPGCVVAVVVLFCLPLLPWTALLVAAWGALAVLVGWSLSRSPSGLRPALLLGAVWAALLLAHVATHNGAGVGVLDLAMDRRGTLLLAGAALALGVALRSWWWTLIVPLAWTALALGSETWRRLHDGSGTVAAHWEGVAPARTWG